ncbi:MAG: tetratricopeptide repeat protein [Myxococcaceae bacterium]|nr:tetratricopeptide repeat protein [Myxococcaceae bacterium]
MLHRAFGVAAALLALAACQKEAPPPATAQDAGAASAPSPPAAMAPVVPDAGPPPEPPRAMALYREADATFQQGDFAKALTQAEAAAAADPSLPLSWNLVGRAAAKQFEATHQARFATTAREAYGRAVKLDPNFLPAWQNLGELEAQLGNRQKAAEAWARVLAIAPDHPDRDRLKAYIEAAGTNAPR